MKDETTTVDEETSPEWLPEPGELVMGKFQVEAVLGHGGMGVVVAAKHKQLGHRVAIKYLRPDLAEDADAVARFTREAQASVALRGEHVARVQDVGTLDSGAPCMVMEYLSGIDLESLVAKRGPLPVADAVQFVLQACEGIAEAHALSIVHRDLKPSNLYLTERPDGSPLIKVLDFGIAKALQPKAAQPTNLTATGIPLGTPMYMSPEQIRDAKASDNRTDIWALGTVLHQLLVGDPPFVAETLPALCAMVVADPPISLCELRGDVPSDLAAVVETCLEKRPDDRYQDVAELAQALMPFAPAAAQVHVDRIVRIVEGRTSLTGLHADDSGSWLAGDSVAATMASTPGRMSGQPTKGAKSELDPPTLIQAATPDGTPNGGATVAARPAKHTAAAWQTDMGKLDTNAVQDESSRHRRTLLAGLAAASVLIVILAIWAVPWSDSAETTSPGPASDVGSGAAATRDGPEPTPAETQAAAPDPSEAPGDEDPHDGAGGKAPSTAEPTATASSQPKPVRAGVPSRPTVRPPPTTTPPTKNTHGSALSDRK